MFCLHVDSDVAAIVMSTKHQGSNHCCSYIYIDLPFAFLPKKYPSVPAFISPSERSASVPKTQSRETQQNIAAAQIIKLLWLHAAQCPEH